MHHACMKFNGLKFKWLESLVVPLEGVSDLLFEKKQLFFLFFFFAESYYSINNLHNRYLHSVANAADFPHQ